MAASFFEAATGWINPIYQALSQWLNALSPPIRDLFIVIPFFWQGKNTQWNCKSFYASWKITIWNSGLDHPLWSEWLGVNFNFSGMQSNEEESVEMQSITKMSLISQFRYCHGLLFIRLSSLNRMVEMYLMFLWKMACLVKVWTMRSVGASNLESAWDMESCLAKGNSYRWRYNI